MGTESIEKTDLRWNKHIILPTTETASGCANLPTPFQQVEMPRQYQDVLGTVVVQHGPLNTQHRVQEDNSEASDSADLQCVSKKEKDADELIFCWVFLHNGDFFSKAENHGSVTSA